GRLANLREDERELHADGVDVDSPAWRRVAVDSDAVEAHEQAGDAALGTGNQPLQVFLEHGLRVLPTEGPQVNLQATLHFGRHLRTAQDLGSARTAGDGKVLRRDAVDQDLRGVEPAHRASRRHPPREAELTDVDGKGDGGPDDLIAAEIAKGTDLG